MKPQVSLRFLAKGRNSPGACLTAESQGRIRMVLETVPSMDDAVVPDEKRMRLRYAGACRVCGVAVLAGDGQRGEARPQS